MISYKSCLSETGSSQIRSLWRWAILMPLFGSSPVWTLFFSSGWGYGSLLATWLFPVCSEDMCCQMSLSRDRTTVWNHDLLFVWLTWLAACSSLLGMGTFAQTGSRETLKILSIANSSLFLSVLWLFWSWTTFKLIFPTCCGCSKWQTFH